MAKFLHWGKITLTHWVDSASVVIASSLPYVVDEINECDRLIFNEVDKKWEVKQVPCPGVVEEYNKYMAGVDRFVTYKFAHIQSQFMCTYAYVCHSCILQVCMHHTYGYAVLSIAG